MAAAMPDSANKKLSCKGRALVLTFLDFFDDLGNKCIEVAGVAARHDAIVRHHRLVDPVGTSIDHIHLDRLVRGGFAAADTVGFNQQPRRMANGGNDFAFGQKSLDELDGRWVLPRLSGFIWPPGRTRAS